MGGTAPAVLNAADEVAVDAFLEGRISFPDISRVIATTLQAHELRKVDSLEAAMAADRWAREHAKNVMAQSVL
jgi:1-deoxy-D-xylulose-5-phosphate reductoisomerase